MPNNIEDFNKGVALVLGKLYESFPKAIELNTNDFPVVEYSDEDPITDEKTDRYLDLCDIYRNTAYFLLDEGYISGYKPDNYTYIEKCRLTSKGLIALQSVPESLKENKSSIGDFFVEIAKDNLKNSTKDAVKYVVQAFFNWYK